MVLEVYVTGVQEKGYFLTQSFKEMHKNLTESGLTDMATFLENARADAVELVIGLHATEESMTDPRVFAVPTRNAYEVGFVFDARSGRNSLVASPIALPWLGD